MYSALHTGVYYYIHLSLQDIRFGMCMCVQVSFIACTNERISDINENDIWDTFNPWSLLHFRAIWTIDNLSYT